MADTMKGLKRTHYCGTVTPEMIGREVVVCGWAQKTRDMGTLVFIDLRDRTGIVQLAFDDKTDPALLAKAQKVRAEYVLMARGYSLMKTKRKFAIGRKIAFTQNPHE